jgi:hypothetical protein
MRTIPFATSVPVYYEGPSLEIGPLPSVFYFALSAQESLTVDPFNQPVAFLSRHPVRIFSVDLPFHGEGLLAVDALQGWADAFGRKEPILPDFFERVIQSIRLLLREDVLIPGQIAAAGLSRGGFVASHIAAQIEEIPYLLTFAPLTELKKAKEFLAVPPSSLLDALDLNLLTSKLCEKKIRTYIGNRDTRVSTDACYQWVRSLIEAAFEKKIRSPHIELILKPSIGHQGHGTSLESFEEGAAWLLKLLKVSP